MAKMLHSSLLKTRLASLNGPEWDSSDEDDEDELRFIQNSSEKKSLAGITAAGLGIRNSGSSSQQANKEDPSSEPSSVIYIGHIPHGFEENEITCFLSQFGKVKRMKVSRSKRTRRSKGYAFVEFDEKSEGVGVAAIVAEALSGYFLLEKRLVCHVLPRDRVHRKLFARCSGTKSHLRPVNFRTRNEEMARRSEEEFNDPKKVKKRSIGMKKREGKKRRKLAELGIDYIIPTVQVSTGAAGEKPSEEKLTEEERIDSGKKSDENKDKTKERRDEERGDKIVASARKESKITSKPPMGASNEDEEVMNNAQNNDEDMKGGKSGPVENDISRKSTTAKSSKNPRSLAKKKKKKKAAKKGSKEAP